MSSMGPEADDETNAGEESPAGRADMPAADGEEISAAGGEDELAAAAEDEPESPGAAVPPPPLPTRPLPRRVPSQNPNRTAPAVSPPTDHTVRHLMNVLKRLP